MTDASQLTLGVLVTYYNEKELLTECLNSLFAGGDAPNVVLVYDDASKWPAINYVPDGVRVQVIRGQTNIGPAKGRNQLLSNCKTDYIHFHDSDDLFHPDWCRRIRQEIECRQTDAVFTEIETHNLTTGNVIEHVLGINEVLMTRDLLRFCIDGIMLVPAGTYRRSSVEAIGGYREQLWQSEDFDFHVRLAAHISSYSIIDDSLVTTRVRFESRSQQRREVYQSMLTAISLLASDLSGVYVQYLAFKATEVGSILYQLGEVELAAKAFELASCLSCEPFARKRLCYRIITKIGGAMFTERLASAYRRQLPAPLRRYAARLGL